MPKTNTTITAKEKQTTYSTFGEITFTEAGTYTYKITEKDDQKPGYTYASEKTIVIHVTDNNGVLMTDWAMEGAAPDQTPTPVMMVNSYHVTPVDVSLRVKKAFADNGYARPVEKSFSFVLKDSEGQTKDIQSVIGSQTAEFTPLTFTKAGTYTYTVSEEKGNETGYTYEADASGNAIEHTVKITVKDKDAVLSASWTWDNTSAGEGTIPTITNTYKPMPAELAIPVKKQFTDNAYDRPEEKDFKFTLSAITAGAPMPASDSIIITGEGRNSFANIAFTKPGEYQYRISETGNSNDEIDAGYIYAGDKVVTVQVTDQNGRLVTDWPKEAEDSDALGSVVFTNTYTPLPATVQIPVEKRWTDDSIDRPADQIFRFRITPESVGTPMPASDNISITVPAGDHTSVNKAAFEEITYIRPGDYVYAINEINDQLPGYSYNLNQNGGAASYTLKVHVADQDGQLVAAYSLNDDAAKQTAVFTNGYNPGVVQITVPVQKAFTDASVSRPSEQTFTFEISAANNDTPMPEVDGGQIGTYATVSGAGTTSFHTVAFTKTGTYVYFISEYPNRRVPAGYTYDKSVYKITVNVSDAGGQLTASYTIEKGEGAKLENGQKVLTGTVSKEDQILFRNVYQPNPVTVTIPVQKVVRGETPESDSQFTFDMVPLGSISDGIQIEAADVPLPGNATGAAQANVTGSGKGAFEAMIYTKPGTYKYEISEHVPAVKDPYDPYTYDAAKHQVIVTVTDNKGKLEASWTLDGESTDDDTSIGFVNAYKVKTVSVPLMVKKSFADHGSVRPVEKQFTFTLKDDNGTELESKSVTGAGLAEFTPLVFDREGIYRYTVSEQNGSEQGYSYDVDEEGNAVEHQIEITVEFDASGELTADWTWDGIAANEHAIPEIENTYEPAAVKLAIPVQKVFADSGYERPQEKEFSFILTAADHAPMPEGVQQGETKTISITGAGDADFGDMIYTRPGTYIYSVSEENTNEPGYTYDTAEHKVTVLVQDKGGILEASWKIDDETELNGTVIFTNSYSPKAASFSIPVEKVIRGDTPSKASEFSFVLQGTTAETPMPDGENAVVRIKGNGTASFPDIIYSETGTYLYTVSEQQGTEDGYEYDKTVYEVNVLVRDENGELKVSWKVNDEEYKADQKVVFVNRYTEEASTETEEAPTETEEKTTETEEDTAVTKESSSGTKGAVQSVDHAGHTDQTPATGDSSPILPLFIFMIASGLFLLLEKSKRKI